ncbi:F-box only protein 28 [Mugil cephalus]|uniref:F-box only protein 28 n=1 Tax=Mugil cephalus TaxID=48193 RepID=UPI001FB7B6F8|nr:F-box only protein 28 [Mugil cephalus]XP_047458611.1 F-box only protein 28 [Mugil cephalus]XP_047458612.1 F-box only protein 28 [Mugil cephalus]
MATIVERVDGCVGSLDSDTVSLRQSIPSPDQPHQNNPLLGLPIVAIETILNFLSYDEISLLRSVCKRMDMICQRVLNQGFLKVERYHSLCQRQVKAQLPRRESERRNHSLARHADILAAVETRLSLLNMTFMKYVDSNLCCFIPGKVIDEIYRVLRYVNSTRAPQRAHEVLQELRDISSMAMEYFDEKVVPILKKKLPGADLSGRLIGSTPVAGPSTSLTTMSLLAKNTPSRSEMTKVQQQVKVNGASMTVLRREMQEIRVKQLEQQKQLQDQEQKLLEQTQVIGEQNARLAELEHKLRELMDSSSAAMGGPRPTPAAPSTSGSSAVSSTMASTSATVLANGSVATASPREAEGEGGLSLKRTRKSSDLPRQSKRLRSKK